MKAVICAVGSVHIHSPGISRWEICRCGNTGAKWDDPADGTLVVASRSRQRGRVAVLGLNNQMLGPALIIPGLADDQARELHDHATDAPGFVFDKSRAGCWAVVFRVGSTSDTRWAAPDEFLECFPDE